MMSQLLWRVKKQQKLLAESHVTKERPPVTILEAHRDLTVYAFAAWVRLMVVVDPLEVRGWPKIKRVLKCSESRAKVIVEELRLKGYVDLEQVHDAQGKPIQLSLLRRAKLAGRDNFIKLSNFLTEHTEQPLYPRTLRELVPGCHLFRKKLGPMLPNVFQEEVECRGCPFQITCLSCMKNYLESPCEAPKVPFSRSCLTEAKSSKQTFIPEGENMAKKKNEARENPIAGKLDLGIISTTWSYSKKQRNLLKKETQNRSFKKTCSTLVEHGDRPPASLGQALASLRTDGELVYKILIKNCPGEHQLFHPGDHDYDQLLEILKRKKTSKARQLLLTRLGEAFARVYSCYRRQFESGYNIEFDKARNLVPEAAADCLIQRISPVQLISHWASEMNKFTNMKFVSLSFACRGVNIGNAQACLPLDWEPEAEEYKKACQRAEARKRRTPVPRAGEVSVRRDILSGYGKEENLDPRIRPGLTEAGFDVSKFDDKFLATFQVGGKIYADNPRTFISEESAPLIKWIARNLYGWTG